MSERSCTEGQSDDAHVQSGRDGYMHTLIFF